MIPTSTIKISKDDTQTDDINTSFNQSSTLISTDDVENSPPKYSINVPNILNRTRAPIYLSIVKNIFGNPGMAITQVLLHHGPWKKESILKNAAIVLICDEENIEPPVPTTYTSINDIILPPGVTKQAYEKAFILVQNTWSLMISQKFIIHAHGLAAYGYPRDLRATTLYPGLSGEKKDLTRFEENKNYDSDSSVPIVIGSRKRSLPSSNSTDSVTRKGSNQAKRPRVNYENDLGVIQEVEIVNGTVANNNIIKKELHMEDTHLWTFSNFAANRRLRGNLILRHVRSCIPVLPSNLHTTASNMFPALSNLPSGALEDIAVAAVDALICLSCGFGEGISVDHTKQHGDMETSLLQSRSASFRVDEICSVMVKNGKISMSSQNVDFVVDVLKQLANLPTPAVSMEKGSGNQGARLSSLRFFIPYRVILTFLQLRTIESIVAERISPLASYAIRTLLHCGPLEERHLSDMLMVPQKESRTVASSLLHRGFVDVQEIPRRPDHHPQFTFYLFSAVRLQKDFTI
jgi:hypothetical protein